MGSYVEQLEYPLTTFHLSHGATPEDYEFKPSQYSWFCKVCHKIATEEHCNSDLHKRNIKWYGAAVRWQQHAAVRLQQLAVIRQMLHHRQETPPPHWCLRNCEEPSMFTNMGESRSWYCQVCKAHATEDHCSSQRHVKNVIYNLNRYRIEGMLSNSVLPFINLTTFETWSHQVTGLGLNVANLMQFFGAPGSSTPAHIVEFTNSSIPPSLPRVESFWGDVYTFMRKIINELLHEGNLKGRGLWHFWGREAEWMNVVVFSDSSREAQARSMSKEEREVGIWWPAIAVPCEDDRYYQTYCQDFAISRSKETWPCRRNRVVPFNPEAPPPPPGAPPDFQPQPPPPPSSGQPGHSYTMQTTVTIEEALSEAPGSNGSEPESRQSYASEYNIYDAGTASDRPSLPQYASAASFQLVRPKVWNRES